MDMTGKEKKTRSINNNNNTDKKQTIALIWIPKIGHQRNII